MTVQRYRANTLEFQGRSGGKRALRPLSLRAPVELRALSAFRAFLAYPRAYVVRPNSSGINSIRLDGYLV